MTDKINIPPEALEAAAAALWRKGFLEYRNLDAAYAAAFALLEAWPGMWVEPNFDINGDMLYLPLTTQENENE